VRARAALHVCWAVALGCSRGSSSSIDAAASDAAKGASSLAADGGQEAGLATWDTGDNGVRTDAASMDASATSSADAATDARGADASVPHCKRGVAYGHHTPADLAALRGGSHFWYNWSPAPEDAVQSTYAAAGMEFVPMVWGGLFDVAQVTSELPSDARFLLGFNEPNFYAQANLSAADAAARWPELEQVAAARGLALVSPAVNYCGGGCHETDPFAYLDAFFAACAGCRVDYIAAHWYACDGPALEWYLGELEKYGKPIWLTEFSCGDAADRSLAVQKKYMTDALAILEQNDHVFRYAWFAGRTTAIPNVDLLGADGELTELGELYVSLPHHDPACAR
jgi:Glycosyl hydrolase catalytic core